MQITEDIREWDYGDYEGLTSAQIKEQREKAGEKVWDIWRDGCPGGESPAEVTNRLDRLITDIRTRFTTKLWGNQRVRRRSVMCCSWHMGIYCERSLCGGSAGS